MFDNEKWIWYITKNEFAILLAIVEDFSLFSRNFQTEIQVFETKFQAEGKLWRFQINHTHQHIILPNLGTRKSKDDAPSKINKKIK
jgi:hypothetical protein